METVKPSAQETAYDRNVTEAVLDVGRNDKAGYRHRYIIGAEESNWTIKALFSTVPYNAPPLSLNMISNALLKVLVPKTRMKIQVKNHPMQNGSEVFPPYFKID